MEPYQRMEKRIERQKLWLPHNDTNSLNQLLLDFVTRRKAVTSTDLIRYRWNPQEGGLPSYPSWPDMRSTMIFTALISEDKLSEAVGAAFADDSFRTGNGELLEEQWRLLKMVGEWDWRQAVAGALVAADLEGITEGRRLRKHCLFWLAVKGNEEEHELLLKVASFATSDTLLDYLRLLKNMPSNETPPILAEKIIGFIHAKTSANNQVKANK